VLSASKHALSLDSAIRAPAANDFARLRGRCPLLETVGLNGKTAGKFAQQFADAGYRTVLLPSTSPAYAAMPFAQKLLAWQRLLAD
jgi:hypoxanthine-DNA glycosylase